MDFVSAKPLVAHAKQNNYATPALNTNGANYDIARAALEACQETNSPLILQSYEPNCEYRGFEYFVNLTEFLCKELSITVPVAISLDHGHSIESIKRAVDAGFTAVMFDASHDPLEKNIELSKQAVKIAHDAGVSVEGEVGYVKGNEPPAQTQIGRVPIPEKPSIEAVKTDIDEALRYVEETNVDLLAVNIGSTHGCYQKQENIDLDWLGKLAESVPVPMVQHGTCGISTELLTKLSKQGMSKINFGEPFRVNDIKYFNDFTDSTEHLWHPWRIMRQVKDKLKSDMIELIRALGAENRADQISL